MRGERARRLASPRSSAVAPFECPHGDERRVAGEPEVVDHGQHVGRESAPVVRVARGIGRVAVAVAAEIERPHAPARRHEPLGDRVPTRPVEAGRVGEQRGRAVAA